MLTVSVFIISLQRAHKRREHMRALMARLGIEAEFVDAVDGATLTPEQLSRYSGRRARRIYGCGMTPSEIGCYLSHLSIYQRMLDRGVETALILEDDISCAADLKAVLDNLRKLRRDDWQVIRLQSTKQSVAAPSSEKGRGEPVRDVGHRSIFRVRTSVLGGCAYLIRRTAAQAMLERSTHIDLPIDQTLDRYWENGIIPYVLRPTPVWHDDLFESEIGRRGRALIDHTPFNVLVRRRAQRMIDSVNKRLFWLAFRIPSLGAVLSAAGVRSARMAMRALWGAVPSPAARA